MTIFNRKKHSCLLRFLRCFRICRTFAGGSPQIAFTTNFSSSALELKWELCRSICFVIRHRAAFQLFQILYMAYQIAVVFDIFHFLAPLFAHSAKFFFLFNSCKSSSAQVGSNSSRRTAAEWVKNPVARGGGSKNHTNKETQRLLRGMLAAGLLPTSDGRQAPNISHLFAIIQLFPLCSDIQPLERK